MWCLLRLPARTGIGKDGTERLEAVVRDGSRLGLVGSLLQPYNLHIHYEMPYHCVHRKLYRLFCTGYAHARQIPLQLRHAGASHLGHFSWTILQHQRPHRNRVDVTWTVYRVHVYIWHFTTDESAFAIRNIGHGHTWGWNGG